MGILVKSAVGEPSTPLSTKSYCRSFSPVASGSTVAGRPKEGIVTPLSSGSLEIPQNARRVPGGNCWFPVWFPSKIVPVAISIRPIVSSSIPPPISTARFIPNTIGFVPSASIKIATVLTSSGVIK